ncbi:glycosyltransferase family 1 protein [uncultured Jannaschia sp.]|uniref:glycosyltransferase family 1 protein n=1 Tax=uncultured Jannaschia sp. TaxID=293347 RepID=UPI00260A2F1A|nr:glycosyltransferase family 1 protein [uncultured Jannaschia sp.]
MLRGGDFDVDVCIVTNCAFPGGNAATTLTELETFETAGLKVLIVHCSLKKSRWKWRWLAERYLPYQDRIVSGDEVEAVRCRTVIVRGPRMIMTRAFTRLVAKITPEHAIFVINNSAWNEDRRPIFSWPELHRKVATTGWRSKEVCPTGPLVRAESARDTQMSDVAETLSHRDWPPVLDETAFEFAPRPEMRTPVVIGRHARDHPGKWLEDGTALLEVYPDGDPDIEVCILGGAQTVEAILGTVPSGWTVLPFGLRDVQEYLTSLDVFVYFPSSERQEAFGRTIVEAILSGLPVILPRRFEATFGDLALYSTPSRVRLLIARLAADDGGRLAYVTACRDLAVSLYARPSLLHRLREGGNIPKPALNEDLAAWREGVMKP